METQNLPNATVVKLSERIDSLSSRDIENTLQAIVAGGARNIICDFTATKYVSSAGLRVLLIVTKALKRSGGMLLIVCAKTGYVYEILETAGFTNLIPMFESVPEAAQTVA